MDDLTKSLRHKEHEYIYTDSDKADFSWGCPELKYVYEIDPLKRNEPRDREDTKRTNKKLLNLHRNPPIIYVIFKCR